MVLAGWPGLLMVAAGLGSSSQKDLEGEHFYSAKAILVTAKCQGGAPLKASVPWGTRPENPLHPPAQADEMGERVFGARDVKNYSA